MCTEPAPGVSACIRSYCGAASSASTAFCRPEPCRPEPCRPEPCRPETRLLRPSPRPEDRFRAPRPDDPSPEDAAPEDAAPSEESSRIRRRSRRLVEPSPSLKTSRIVRLYLAILLLPYRRRMLPSPGNGQGNAKPEVPPRTLRASLTRSMAWTSRSLNLLNAAQSWRRHSRAGESARSLTPEISLTTPIQALAGE